MQTIEQFLTSGEHLCDDPDGEFPETEESDAGVRIVTN